MKCSACGADNLPDADFCARCREPIKTARKIHGEDTATLVFDYSEIVSGSLLADRYRVMGELGHGGMGLVVKARDEVIDDLVALKLLKPEISQDRTAVGRFRNEVKFTRKISHKNVCRMYEFGQWKDTLYIVMEFVPGEDLGHLLRNKGLLGVERILSIVEQICRGLRAAHEFGVIHRDLKPRNIMIDESGVVRILDFGVARMRKTADITSEGISVGTPRYMSPEQVDGGEVDERSDIYALGVILYEMAVGQAPFEGGNPFSIALRQKTARPVDPKSLNPGIPPSLDAVILKCLEKDPKNRYQDVDSLMTDLALLRESLGMSERNRIGGGEPRTVSPFIKKSIPWVLVPVLVLLLIGYLIRERNNAPPRGLENEKAWKNSIAVLPFNDLSPDQDQTPVCRGMTDDLVTHLHRRFPDLKVIPTISSERYLDTDKSIEEIGMELGVRTLLTGNLQIENPQIRVNVSLNSTESGSLIWSRRFEGEINSYFAVQDDIAESLGRELRVHFESGKEFPRHPQPPFDAMKSYYKGRFHERIYRKTGNPKDFDKALEYYTAANRGNGEYALFYWGLGNIFEARFVSHGKDEDLDRMLVHYERAYALDKDLAEANIALGWVHFYLQRNDRAYEYFLRAYTLDPYNPDINYQIGSFFRSLGLFRKSIRYYSQALTYDPLKPETLRLRARCYMNIADYGSALRDIMDAMEITPDNMSYSLFYIRLLVMLGRYVEAEEEVEELQREAGRSRGIQYIRALLSAVRGEGVSALSVIDNIENPVVMTYLLSSVHAVLGMHDEAIGDIRNGMKMGFQATKEYLYGYSFLISNPFFDSLKQDRRFQEIILKAKDRYDRMLIEYGAM